MRVMRGDHRSWDAGVAAMAVTVGVYDGVHTGHRAVFDQMRAPHDGLPLGIVTFDRHPVALLAPERVPALLTSMDQKLEAFEAAGIDVVGVLEFDEAMAAMPAEAFIEEVIGEAMAASLVVVGRDFRFGHERRGSVAMLEELGTTLGFDVVGLDLHEAEGSAVSSSRIRGLIANGDVASAGELLGRRYVLSGAVVPGAGRGTELGFSTANVEFDRRMVEPAHGVYAVWVQVGDATYRGAANLGVRPTFGGPERAVLEVHILDFDGEVRGDAIDVEFVTRLRNEKRFHGAEELAAQVMRDVARVRNLLG